jgi:uncharacterized protein
MKLHERKIQIRDPIHGTIEVSKDELTLIDHRAYQRLRTIKQLGLADLAFPGATHTRYAHGLGTMHIATRMFHALARHYELEAGDRQRLLTTVRLAALFHDLGHAPLSHSTEAFMPQVSRLGIPEWISGTADRQATHEDYTLKLLVDSDLTELLKQRFAHQGVSPEDLAAIIAGRGQTPDLEQRFVVGGLNWFPAIRQCVSSELDADRMDYLLRDSYYAGVPYGKYDHEWLLDNLLPVEDGGRIHLGLDARATFGFEDYLLSRYHMFMSVYFHHIPTGYEVMLEALYRDARDSLFVPSDSDGYLDFDDVALLGMLRKSPSEWASRIVRRKAYRMAYESQALRHDEPEDLRDASPAFSQMLSPREAENILREHGIPLFAHKVRGRLSKYFHRVGSAPPHSRTEPPLFIVQAGQFIPVESYSPLYRRYAGGVDLERLYVEPERLSEARSLLTRR